MKRGLSLLALAGAAACGPGVDCEALCEDALACLVTFDAPDDPDAERVASGERTERESCRLGCEASPRVDPESAACAAAANTGDPETCQEEMRACFGFSS